MIPLSRNVCRWGVSLLTVVLVGFAAPLAVLLTLHMLSAPLADALTTPVIGGFLIVALIAGSAIFTSEEW